MILFVFEKLFISEISVHKPNKQTKLYFSYFYPVSFKLSDVFLFALSVYKRCTSIHFSEHFIKISNVTISYSINN